MLETGCYHLPGEDCDAVDIDDQNTLTVLFGGLVECGMLQMGLRGGHHVLHPPGWDGVPVAQVTVVRFAVGAEYKAFGTNK